MTSYFVFLITLGIFHCAKLSYIKQGKSWSVNNSFPKKQYRGDVDIKDISSALVAPITPITQSVPSPSVCPMTFHMIEKIYIGQHWTTFMRRHSLVFGIAHTSLVDLDKIGTKRF